MTIYGSERHPFICTDPAAGKLLWFDAEGRLTKEIGGISCCYDVWVLADGSLLYSHFGGPQGDGFTRTDPDGKPTFTYRTEREVFGCQPLPNGHVLTGELGPRRLCEVSPDGQIVREIPVAYEGVAHECMRMPRKTDGRYLVVQPGTREIAEFDAAGRPARRFATRHDTFGVVALPNGHLLYTCMEGAVALDEQGREVWTLTDADVPDVHIRWLLGVQLRVNGNLVFTNWMGHGHRDEGIPFFEVTPTKKLVWACDTRGLALEPASLQLLDEEAAAVCGRPMK